MTYNNKDIENYINNIEVEDDDFSTKVRNLVEELDKGLADIDALPRRERGVGYIMLQNKLKLKKGEFLKLVNDAIEDKQEKPPSDFLELRKWQKRKRREPLIPDLLGTGLTLFAADGGTGKSSVCYEIAEAITTGGKFADQFQAKKGTVLFFQLDEGDDEADLKWEIMMWKPDHTAIRIEWSFNKTDIPELLQLIDEVKPDLVIFDSLFTIAGGQISPKDAEFALFLYRLKRISTTKQIAIVMTHHTRKKETKKPELTANDIFGTVYLKNASTDVWGYWKEVGEAGETIYNLKRFKSRGNTMQVGQTYLFDGSEEDQRVHFKRMKGLGCTLDELSTHRKRIATYILDNPDTYFTSDDISQKLSINKKYTDKVLRELAAAKNINKKPMPSTGGRPPYIYFAIQKNF